MYENKWYRNQVDLYAMMIGDNNNKIVKSELWSINLFLLINLLKR